MVMSSQPAIYVDSDAPNDSGAGTEASPKKYLSNSLFSSAAAIGATILLRRDRFYTPEIAAFHPTISGKTDFIFGSYGDGPNPVIDSLYWELPGTPEAAGWASVGNGVWSKSYPTGTWARRLAVGAKNTGNRRALRNPGKWMRRVKTLAGAAPALQTIKDAMGPADIWYGPRDGGAAATSGTHYIYTGRDDEAGNPVTFYNGLCWNMDSGKNVPDRRGVGGPAVQVQHSTNVLVVGIDSWGSTSFGFSVTGSSASTRNVVFKNCHSYYHYSGSHTARSNMLPSVGEVSDILFEDCDGDSGTGPDEQEPTPLYGWLSGGMDMMTAYDYVRNVLFRRCRSINSFHVAFCMGAYNLRSARSDNCGFEDCTAYFDSWMTYSRGLSTNPCMPNCFIRNTLIDGQNIRSQFNGKARIYGNTWVNMRRSARYPDRSGWACSYAEITVRSAANNERYVYNQPEDVWVMHNTVEDPIGVPYLIETFAASDYSRPDLENVGQNMPLPVLTPNCVHLVNNVLYDRKSVDIGALDTVSYIERAVLIPQQDIRNNVVHGVGLTTKAPSLGRWNSSGFVSRTPLNDTPDAAGTNLFADPKIDLTDPRNPKMAKDSPCRRAGRTTGQHKRDMKGRPFLIPPSIGPLEFTGGSPRA